MLTRAATLIGEAVGAAAAAAASWAFAAAPVVYEGGGGDGDGDGGGGEAGRCRTGVALLSAVGVPLRPTRSSFTAVPGGRVGM